MKISIIKNKLIRIIIPVIFWLVIWQTAALAVNKVILIPTIDIVLKRIAELVMTLEFWKITSVSIMRIIIGFFLGVLCGTVIAILTSFIQLADIILSPIIRIISAAPVVSFIILAIVWIKTNNVPIFITMLMVTPIIWSNVSMGIHKTDKKLLEMAKVFCLERKNIIFKIYLPQVIPYFISASITGIGLAWKSGIAAEVLCTPKLAVGTKLQQAKVYLETPDVFAWTVIVIILSITLEKLFIKIIYKKKYG